MGGESTPGDRPGGERSLWSFVVVAALVMPSTVLATSAALRLGAAPPARLDPFYYAVPNGTGRVWCRDGVFVPSPSGRSYSCPWGGEFRCEVEACELYRGVRIPGEPPTERWLPTRDEKSGKRVLAYGETRSLAGGTWYGSLPAAAPGSRR